MAEQSRFKIWAATAVLVGITAGAAVGCSAGNEPPGKAVGDNSSGGGNTGTGGKSSNGGSSVSGAAGTISVSGTGGGQTDAGGPCVPATCNPVGGNYCGQVGDGCNGSIDCGVCQTTGWVCEEHVCVGPPGVCTPNTACTVGSATFCGTIGDGCGHGVDCGTCAPGLECRNRLCVAPGCVPAASCGAADGVTVSVRPTAS